MTTFRASFYREKTRRFGSFSLRITLFIYSVARSKPTPYKRCHVRETTHTDTKSVQRQVSCFVLHRIRERTCADGGVVFSPLFFQGVRPLFLMQLLLPFSNSPDIFLARSRYLARCFAPFSLSYFMAQTFPYPTVFFFFFFFLFFFFIQSCPPLLSRQTPAVPINIASTWTYKSDATRIPNLVRVFIYTYKGPLLSFLLTAPLFSLESPIHHHSTSLCCCCCCCCCFHSLFWLVCRETQGTIFVASFSLLETDKSLGREGTPIREIKNTQNSTLHLNR